jgi:hypothetical protein
VTDRAGGIRRTLQKAFGDGLRSGSARLLFTLSCAGLGAAIMLLTMQGFAGMAAAAGGTAAWLASDPDWQPRWRGAVVVVVGVLVGILLGVQYY